MQGMTHKKAIVQASSFGNPQPRKDRRFFRFASRILTKANSVLYPVTIVSYAIFLALLVYAGIGIEHSVIYPSDGTMNSCEISPVKFKR